MQIVGRRHTQSAGTSSPCPVFPQLPAHLAHRGTLRLVIAAARLRVAHTRLAYGVFGDNRGCLLVVVGCRNLLPLAVTVMSRWVEFRLCLLHCSHDS